MAEFKKSGGFKGKKPSGGPRHGGSNRSGGSHGGYSSRPQPELFDAVCSDCGNGCQVPFRPNGQKPVLCRDCFGGKPVRDQGKPSHRDAKRGFGGRDDHRSGGFASRRSQDNTGNDELKRRIDVLDKKMDVIIDMLGSFAVDTNGEMQQSALKRIVQTVTRKKKS